MRREAYLAGLFSSAILSAVASLAWLISPVMAIIERVAWPEYQMNPHEAVTLGFIAPPGEPPASWRKFRAFIERSAGHPNYTAGHFDPGRTA